MWISKQCTKLAIFIILGGKSYWECALDLFTSLAMLCVGFVHNRLLAERALSASKHLSCCVGHVLCFTVD